MAIILSKKSLKSVRKYGLLSMSCLAIPLYFLQTADAQTEVPHTDAFTFPLSYVAVTSGPASTGTSWITMINAQGDDDQAAQPLLNGMPLGFTLDPTGSFGEAVESTSSLNYFPVGPALTPGVVGTNTLPDAGCVSNVFAPAGQLFTLDYKSSAINIGTPVEGGAKGQFGISLGDTVGTTPVAMTGNSSTGRYIVISQNLPYGVACNNIPHEVTETGTGTVFESSSGTTVGVGTIPLGRCPVFGVTSADGQRSFILNRGDNSITVINTVQAEVDQNYPAIDIPAAPGTNAGPVYAEYVPRVGKLLVANYENDTVTVINAQLTDTGADGPAFGTIIKTVDLWNGASHVCGKHPASIAALPDGTRAYVANQEDGTISVLDLRLNEVVSTINLNPGKVPTAPCASTLPVHPRSVAVLSNAGTNSLIATIYVGAPTGNAIPYIYAVDNTLVMPSCPNSNGVCAAAGNINEIRTSAQNAADGVNHIISSRLPGAGEPCESPNFAPANLAACLAN